MPQQSLFKACKNIYRSGVSGTELVGNNNISFELYHQSDIDANVKAIARGEATGCTFGDSDESKVVLVMDDSITIPLGFTLTPVNPKKSLVICCNTFTNNGTISMQAKGPNTLPHDWFILGKLDNYGELNNIIIPAYANNQVNLHAQGWLNGSKGQDGTNRQCGSGGTSGCVESHRWVNSTSGSGYAFGGGAGGSPSTWDELTEVDPIYPMRGCPVKNPGGYNDVCREGGVGNPVSTSWTYGTTEYRSPAFGVGGRVVIFCSEFENNGVISSNGTDQWEVYTSSVNAYRGGASGGGAVDIFYYTLITEGTITANGGAGYSNGGAGGNGCVTSLQWTIDKVVKPQEKYMSKNNMIYFLQQLVNKINGE